MKTDKKMGVDVVKPVLITVRKIFGKLNKRIEDLQKKSIQNIN